MSRHEIEIEGLGPEWEAVGVNAGQHVLDHDGADVKYVGAVLKIRRKVRKYDWSKTLDDVLILRPNTTGMTLYCGHGRPTAIPDGIWQPNIHGKCPVDGEACIVRVRFADGTCHEGIAAKFTWVLDGEFDDIIAWQFIRLADGWEF